MTNVAMGRYWTPDLDVKLAEYWALGETAEEIAFLMSLDVHQIWARARHLKLPHRKRNMKLTSSALVLNCLRCRQPFKSLDRKAHRLCDDCKRHPAFSHDCAYEVNL